MENQSPVQRLAWLCEEVVNRIEEEQPDDRFGDVFKLVDEIESLAKELQIAFPPIQIVRYKRGETGRQSTAPETFSDWRRYEGSTNPKILAVFGYRLHDPMGSDAPREFAVTTTAEGGAEGQHLTGVSKGKQRRLAARMLRRWVRALAPRDHEGTVEERFRLLTKRTASIEKMLHKERAQGTQGLRIRRQVKEELKTLLSDDALVLAYKQHGSYRKAAATLSIETRKAVSKDAIARAVKRVGGRAAVLKNVASRSIERRWPSQRLRQDRNSEDLS